MKVEDVVSVKCPVVVILYLTYFPKCVSVPIERWEDFSLELKKIENAAFSDLDRWKKALYFTLFGCFMKVVIADRLGVYVDKLFDG